ncbi:MAG: hypothetical protein WCO44_02515 [Bacteroidota bacterium]
MNEENAGMQECRNAGMQECSNAVMQECRNAGMQKCRNAEMQVMQTMQAMKKCIGHFFKISNKFNYSCVNC